MLEYAEGGTLFDKIKMGAISKKEIKQYFRDICEALAYLHSQNIMHRDIKVSFQLQSLKMSYLRKITKPNYVILVLQQF